MDSGHIAADVVSQQLQSVFVSLRQSVVLFARAFWGLGPLGSDKAKDSTGCFVFWGRCSWELTPAQLAHVIEHGRRFQLQLQGS